MDMDLQTIVNTMNFNSPNLWILEDVKLVINKVLFLLVRLGFEPTYVKLPQIAQILSELPYTTVKNFHASVSFSVHHELFISNYNYKLPYEKLIFNFPQFVWPGDRNNGEVIKLIFFRFLNPNYHNNTIYEIGVHSPLGIPDIRELAPNDQLYRYWAKTSKIFVAHGPGMESLHYMNYHKGYPNGNLVWIIRTEKVLMEILRLSETYRILNFTQLEQILLL
jgi:hypothetical protein